MTIRVVPNKLKRGFVVMIAPYFLMDHGSWSFTDSFIESLFDRIQSEGKVEAVFMAGDVKTSVQFREAMQNGSNCLYVIESENNLCGVMWLNRFEGKMARIHFCGFKGTPLSDMIDAATTATNELLEHKDDKGHLLDVLVGYIASKNKAAIMLVRAAGFTVSGIIPHAVFNEATGESEDAVVLYKKRQQ